MERGPLVTKGTFTLHASATEAAANQRLLNVLVVFSLTGVIEAGPLALSIPDSHP
jgi:hypothetical protein